MSSKTPKRADSPEVLERVKEGLVLCEIVAKQLKRQVGSSTLLDDLISEGREGLLAAARSFDPSRGIPFPSWAKFRIRGAMLDSVRRNGGLPRRVYQKVRAVEAASYVQEAAVEEQASAPPQTPESADAKLSELAKSAAMAMAMGFLAMAPGEEAERVPDEEGTPEEIVARKEIAKKVKAAIFKLPDSERAMVEAYYFRDETIEAAGKKMGLSKSWACRLHARAIRLLSEHLTAKSVE